MAKQISVFLDNKPGMLEKVTGVLKDNGIDMRALTLADSTDYGILRVIANDTDKAVECLTKSGYITKVNKVVAVVIDDEAGGLAGVIKTLSESGINIEYLYVFVTRFAKQACGVIRVKDYEQAVADLSSNGFKMLDDKSM